VKERPVATTDADIVDRLARLGAILPAMAEDLAAARRRASALEAENERLRRRVGELEATAHFRQRPLPASR